MLSAALRHLSMSLPDTVQFQARRRLLVEAADEVELMTRPLDADVRQFHIRFGHPAPVHPVLLSRKAMEFRKELMREEGEELFRAIDARDMIGVVDGVVDLTYVLVGTLVSCGVPFGPAWRSVHDSNMAKVRNPEGGKPLKPEGWTPPDFSGILAGWGDEE